MNKNIKIIDNINKNRQSVKSYSNQKIDDGKWNMILETIYWAPSSHGFEPYRIIVINKNNTIRKQLTPLMWNQGIVEEADKLIFFISLKRSIFNNAEWVFERSYRRFKIVADQDEEKAKASARKMTNVVLKKHLAIDELEGDSWAMKQAYLALGMALSAATILNIGSTPMEGMEKNKITSLFKENLLINENENIAVAAAFGYPSSNTSYAHFGSGKRVRDSKVKKINTI